MYGLGVTYHTNRPAWQQWSPGQQIDPYDIPDEILETWVESGPGRPGYNPRTGCYCWGYRPAYLPQTLEGVRWSAQRTPWKICTGACPQQAAKCPTCPPPAPPQQCPTCPTCPEPVLLEDDVHAVAKPINDHRNWLWLAGAGFAVVATYAIRRTIQINKKK